MSFANGSSSSALYHEDATYDANAYPFPWPAPNVLRSEVTDVWDPEDLKAPVRYLATPSMDSEGPSATSSLSDSSNFDDNTSWDRTAVALGTTSVPNTNWAFPLLMPFEPSEQFHVPQLPMLEPQPSLMTDVTRSPQPKHTCNFPGCFIDSGKIHTFSDKAGLKRHMQRHDTNPNLFVCGECGQTRFRKDHLLGHLRNCHGLRSEESAASCPYCAKPKNSRRKGPKGVLFSKLASLEKHLAETHKESESDTNGTSTPSFNSSTSGTVRDSSPATSLFVNPSDHANVATACISKSPDMSPGAKHQLQPELKSAAKRGKFGNGKIHLTHGPESLSGDATSSNIRQTPFTTSLGTDIVAHLASNLPSSCEIRCVRMIDIMSLLSFHSVQQPGDFMDVAKIFFNASKGILELRGPSSSVQATKAILENGLKEARRLIPIASCSDSQSRGSALIKSSARSKSNISACSHPSPTPKTIFAVRGKEDSDVCVFWTNHILPVLSHILLPLLGKNYSAILVRRGSTSESAVPAIRISSVFRHTGPIRSQITSKIHALCAEHGKRNIALVFSTSKIQHIARSDSEFEHEEDQMDEPLLFPHQKRDWRQPGMGASIGYNDVSATLGGYILIDQQIYMLTVDHLFEKGRSDENAAVTSPSLDDVATTMGDIEQTFREIEAEAGDLLLGVNTLSESFSLEQLRSEPQFMEKVDNLQLWRGYYKELKRDDQTEFDLGVVFRRSGTRYKPTSGGFLLPDQTQAQCRMNWSIVKVKTNRLGENRHRHKLCPGGGNEVDLTSENQYPKGAGPLCQDTCQVSGSDQVYFVGESSGHQTGQVSAVRSLISCDGIVSYEWTIFPDQHREAANYHGDSGAWVLRSSDNALVGLLWCWCDDQLVFTAIGDVFADIRESLNAHDIHLPSSMHPHPPPDTSAQVSAGPGGMSIARKQEKIPRAPRNLFGTRRQLSSSPAKAIPKSLVESVETKLKSIDVKVPEDQFMAEDRLGSKPVVNQLVENNVDTEVKTVARTTTPSIDSESARSLTPAPSLSHSDASCPETPIRSLPTRSLKSDTDYFVGSFKVTAAREDAHDEFIPGLRDELLSGSVIRFLPERTLRKCKTGNKHALDYILQDSDIRGDPSPSFQKMLMDDLKTLQLIEDWRTTVYREVV